MQRCIFKSESVFSIFKTNSYFFVSDIVVKNKSNVVNRGLYSCRQRYAALQWSKCCATNWATSPSALFALVIEYVSSIHPWANSRCWISQSERALCFSYVINLYQECKSKPPPMAYCCVYIPNCHNNTSTWNCDRVLLQCTDQVCFFLPFHYYSGMLQCFLKDHNGLIIIIFSHFLCDCCMSASDMTKSCSPDLVYQFWLERHLHYYTLLISMYHSGQTVLSDSEL